MMNLKTLSILSVSVLISACAVNTQPPEPEVKPMQEQTRNHYIGSSFIGTVKAVNGGEVLFEGKRGSLVKVITNPLESPFSVGETAVFVTPDNPYIHTGKSELIKWHIWKERRDQMFTEQPKKILKNIKQKEESVFK